MVTSTYVMPWYPAMVLPVVALAWRSRASVLVQVQAAFLLARVRARRAGQRSEPRPVGQLLEERALWINVALLAAAVLLEPPVAGRVPTDPALLPTPTRAAPS